MEKFLVTDLIADGRSVVTLNTPDVTETAAAPVPSKRPFDLPTEETAVCAYILDYFAELGVAEQEASPLLDEILAKAKPRCEAILFFLIVTGVWERSADWLTLAIRDTALEAYSWNQLDKLIERFRKNWRYWQDAEDIAHKVIIQAVTAIRRGRRPRSLLKNWFSRFASFSLLDHHRKESAQPRTIYLSRAEDERNDSALFQKLRDPGPSPKDQAVCRMTLEELAARNGREAVDAWRFTTEGYTQKQIAKMCGATERTVRRWLEQAAPIIKGMLKETG
jgi:RNA polymerase sigma factor (sigma-70 family)